MTLTLILYLVGAMLTGLAVFPHAHASARQVAVERDAHPAVAPTAAVLTTIIVAAFWPLVMCYLIVAVLLLVALAIFGRRG